MGRPPPPLRPSPPPGCLPIQQRPQLVSRNREARDDALAKTITEAVTKEMAKADAQYQALLNDRSAALIPTSLKVTSEANGFKVMDLFDWTKEKSYLPEMAIVVREG